MLVFFLNFLGAMNNGQKIQPIDSDIYSGIEKLYLMEGHSLPSTAGPWSEAELLNMLEGVTPSNSVSQKLYDHIAGKLSVKPQIMMGEEFGSSFNINTAFEVYAHTNEVFKDEHYWVHGFNDRKKFLDVEWDLWGIDNIYIYFDAVLLMNSLGNHHNNIEGNYLYKNKLVTNVPLLPPANFGSDGDFTFPYRSFGSFGGDHWNLSIGRDRFSWGPGESGNFMVGSHFIQHDFLKFTTFNNDFKYTLLSSFFPPDASMGKDQNAEFPGFTMLLAHRVEFSLLKDKLGLALSESVTYKTTENTLNLAAINPFGFFHNEYIRGMANSLITVELDYNPFGYVDFYAQFALDDIALGTEVKAPAKGASPNAFGYMLGAKAAFPVKEEYVAKVSIEGALTNPFLYLRGLDGKTSHGYGHDALFKNCNKDGDFKRLYLGYKYGGDAIVLHFTSSLKKIGRWSTFFNTMYMWHGNKRLDSPWSAYGYNGQNALVITPSGDVIERTLTLSLGGKYDFEKLPGMYIKGNIDYINVVNMKSDTPTPFEAVDYNNEIVNLYLNIKDNNHYDIQTSFCIGYTF